MQSRAENVLKAVLHSAKAPDQGQKERFLSFLRKNYGNDDIELIWEKDEGLRGGMKLVVGTDIYDWSREGMIRKFKDHLRELRLGEGELVPLMREAIDSFEPDTDPEELGRVISVGDEIAEIGGLPHAAYGEILQFSSGIKGMVQDLGRDHIGCVIFGDTEKIREGSLVRRTRRTAGMPVGEAFLGRVINALGDPIDGGRPIEAEGFRPIECAAPGILKRQPVDTPMETGILCIDSMFPIGRGQRELIIGDRQTGKTAVAIDTILNQKGKDVVCIYVAIGQKNSSVAQLAANLRKRGAMEYTIIVNASSGDTAAMQYIAPYAGCALGEYFMYAGRDVLIVYDDLSKHAIAYRALSLLLGRSPGREAYPGDVFYLHSRLLERSAHLCDELGGGSMTALPIVETQAGDVSAYIPTNIISITDGQLFLESDLFFEGQRPAVNVGLSVSRVGGDAQTKAMKKAAGTLRLDLAQYREMEVFTQFSSDLDESTRAQLLYGQGLMRLLRQPQYQPYPQLSEVILLVCATAHILQDMKAEQIDAFKEGLISYVREADEELCKRIGETGLLSDEDSSRIIELSGRYHDIFMKGAC